ncbi:MAG: hypothetical protein B6U76_00990 [Desulfurococcales archaeon ex4484_217_2]|nr:MAG: hypothetical protein B6U76_00990 [Desulfurococcales archaeon ex4484_217_2]
MPRPKFTFRSPVTILLLILLRNRPLPTHIISVTLRERSNYVSAYLCRLRDHGLIKRDKYGYWSITDLGIQYLAALERAISNIEELVEKLNNDLTIKLATIINRNATKMQQKATKNNKNSRFNRLESDLTSFEKIVEEAERRLGRGLSEVEYAILKYLYEFERITGRKYWWPPERNVSLAESLAEELRISSINTVSTALRELEAKGILYMTFDKRKNVPKVRIDKSINGMRARK